MVLMSNAVSLELGENVPPSPRRTTVAAVTHESEHPVSGNIRNLVDWTVHVPRSLTWMASVLAVSWTWLLRNKLLVFGALCSFSGILVALIALLPAFKGQDLSQGAVNLAEWTALKDFWEYCTTIKENGDHVSEECKSVLEHPLPAPPHVYVETHVARLANLLPRQLRSSLQPSTDASTWHAFLQRTFICSISVALLMIGVLCLLKHIDIRRSVARRNTLTTEKYKDVLSQLEWDRLRHRWRNGEPEAGRDLRRRARRNTPSSS